MSTAKLFNQRNHVTCRLVTYLNETDMDLLQAQARRLGLSEASWVRAILKSELARQLRRDRMPKAKVVRRLS